MTLQTRRLILVEDNDLLRDLLATALESQGYIVHVAPDAEEAKRVLTFVDPDGVVLDIELGHGPNGFELAQFILQKSPGTGIVFLSDLPDARFASKPGEDLPRAVAYIRKSSLNDLRRLYEAVDLSMRGEVTSEYRDDQDKNRPFADLTRKQIEVLRYMAAGKSNAQIAELRGTSLKATEDAIHRSCRAIGVQNMNEGNLRATAVARFLSVVGVLPDLSSAS